MKTFIPPLVLALCLACGGGGSGSPQVQPPPPGPRIEGFYPHKSNCSEGDAIRLTWSAPGATKLVLNPGARDVSGLNQAIVVPSATTTYALTAYDAQGQTTASTSILVAPASSQPVLEHLGVSQPGIVAGQSVRLTWIAPRASEVTIEPGQIQTAHANHVNLKPTADTTYTVTVRNSRGSQTGQVGVKVLPAASRPVIQTFGPSSGSVKTGETVTLTWVVQGADRVQLEPGGKDVTANTACFVVPTSSTTYRLVATNVNGEASASAAVSVQGTGLPMRIPHEQLLEDLRVLTGPTMEGRMVGSPGGAKAREYLKRRFQEMGLQPLGASYEQPWQRGGYQGANVVGLIPGTTFPQKTLVIGGHYDHIGADLRGLVRPGADDNASGACAVLALAAWFAQHPPAHRMVFALFDGEEMGLHGSYAFTENPPIPLSEVDLFVNFDMVSRSDYGKIGVAGTSTRPGLRPHVTQAAAGWPTPIEFGHENYLQYSDQYPFYRKQIPYLWFFCVDHDDYHTWRDTYERISPDYFRTTVEIALGSLLALDPLDAVPAYSPFAAPPLSSSPIFPIAPDSWRTAARPW